MKLLLALTMTFAGVANAFDFSPGPTYSCSTYCTGYVTTDQASVVDYVNLQYASPTLGYRVTMSVNGNVYQGYESAPGAGGTLFSADGTFITLSNVAYTYKHTCTRSGRGQHCTSWYFVDGGTVTP